MINTLSSMSDYLDQCVMDDAHPLREVFLNDLQQCLVEFNKLKKMLEECIDINKAKNNDYIINPNFSPELQAINQDLTKARRRLE